MQARTMQKQTTCTKAMSPATTIARDGCGHPASLWLAVKGPSLSAWAAQQGGENQGHGTHAARSTTCRRRQATQRGVYSERKATTGPRWGTSGRLWKGGERCRKRRRGARRRRACMQAHKNASSLQAATCQNCLCKAPTPDHLLRVLAAKEVPPTSNVLPQGTLPPRSPAKSRGVGGGRAAPPPAADTRCALNTHCTASQRDATRPTPACTPPRCPRSTPVCCKMHTRPHAASRHAWSHIRPAAQTAKDVGRRTHGRAPAWTSAHRT